MSAGRNRHTCQPDACITHCRPVLRSPVADAASIATARATGSLNQSLLRFLRRPPLHHARFDSALDKTGSGRRRPPAKAAQLAPIRGPLQFSRHHSADGDQPRLSSAVADRTFHLRRHQHQTKARGTTRLAKYFLYRVLCGFDPAPSTRAPSALAALVPAAEPVAETIPDDVASAASVLACSSSNSNFIPRNSPFLTRERIARTSGLNQLTIATAT